MFRVLYWAMMKEGNSAQFTLIVSAYEINVTKIKNTLMGTRFFFQSKIV